MTIIIKTQDQTTTLFASQSTFENGYPEVWFSRDNWNKAPRPKWITNEGAQREGGFKHYNGSSDQVLPITMYLYGTNSNTNLNIINSNVSSPIYLDANDIDSNLTGNYVVTSIRVNRNRKISVITVDMNLEEYNN